MESLQTGRKRNSTGESMPYRKKYSVYHKKTDQPLIVYASSKECAKAMGIVLNSFYRYISRMREGKINLRKWSIYEDEVEDIEDGEE